MSHKDHGAIFDVLGVSQAFAPLHGVEQLVTNVSLSDKSYFSALRMCIRWFLVMELKSSGRFKSIPRTRFQAEQFAAALTTMPGLLGR